VTIDVSRRQALDLRLRAQQLDRTSGSLATGARNAVTEQAERLAAVRGLDLAAVEWEN
jgi:hypothetical protein